jgi:hypothetical protein
MGLTDQDLEAFARRIRPYFEPPLRDVAEGIALRIARSGAGARTKQLRPETPLGQVLSWLDDAPLQRVQLVVNLEVDMGLVGPIRASSTFRELVERIAGMVVV